MWFGHREISGAARPEQFSRWQQHLRTAPRNPLSKRPCSSLDLLDSDSFFVHLELKVLGIGRVQRLGIDSVGELISSMQHVPSLQRESHISSPVQI